MKLHCGIEHGKPRKFYERDGTEHGRIDMMRVSRIGMMRFSRIGMMRVSRIGMMRISRIGMMRASRGGAKNGYFR